MFLPKRCLLWYNELCFTGGRLAFAKESGMVRDQGNTFDVRRVLVMSDIVCIAHRGASGHGHAPENTLAAFRAAMEIGVDGVECDVHCTGDGHVVVIHDSTLDRTTDMSGVIEKMTLDEVKKADAGSWFDPRFAGEHVPMLREVLELTREKVITVIEIKPDNITDEVVKEVEKAAAAGGVVLQSFHPGVVRDSWEISPQIPRALLVGGKSAVRRLSDVLDLIQKAAEVGAGALNLSSKIITPQLIEESHRRGISVWAWTVDNEADMKSLAAMGVNGITSNYPEKLHSALSI
jgi:glycerophosphoryl diester phosphodiesterase